MFLSKIPSHACFSRTSIYLCPFTFLHESALSFHLCPLYWNVPLYVCPCKTPSNIFQRSLKILLHFKTSRDLAALCIWSLVLHIIREFNYYCHHFIRLRMYIRVSVLNLSQNYLHYWITTHSAHTHTDIMYHHLLHAKMFLIVCRYVSNDLQILGFKIFTACGLNFIIRIVNIV